MVLGHSGFPSTTESKRLAQPSREISLYILKNLGERKNDGGNKVDFMLRGGGQYNVPCLGIVDPRLMWICRPNEGISKANTKSQWDR